MKGVESGGSWRNRLLEGALIYLSPTVLTTNKGRYRFGLKSISSVLVVANNPDIE